ncbi:MAG: hypothetical protein KQH63_04965 [Desulfobulbaceae bacterium]|nr:hypothetical protein [Desulfobulbaceae bacterium]
MKNRSEKNWRPEGEVETPYKKAKKEWDDRMGNAIVQARNWRMMCFALVLLMFFCCGGLVYVGQQPKQVPHIVEVKEDGSSRYVGDVGRSWEEWTPKASNIKFHLRRFVTASREIVSDPVVMKKRWFDAYSLITPEASKILSAWVQDHDPFLRAQKELVSIDIYSMVPLSKESWQVDWNETVRSVKGNQIGLPKKWRGIFTLKFEQPRTAKLMESNPIGLYITDFSWTTIN